MPSLVEGRRLRVLDLDIETRRIGFHNAGRFAPDGCEPVIIAMTWDDEPEVETYSLKPRWTERDARRMMEAFRTAYDEADLVTGHYITKFDLPILNGALLEWGMAPLGQKLVLDTKVGLIDIAGLSASQENLSALKDLEASKFHMNDNWWRKVARLTPEGLALATERVISDVIQHRMLRTELADWTTTSVWSPR
jgi:hypothetical protein